MKLDSPNCLGIDTMPVISCSWKYHEFYVGDTISYYHPGGSKKVSFKNSPLLIFTRFDVSVKNHELKLVLD